MSPSKSSDRTLLARGKRYRDSAAVVIGNIALDAQHAAALAAVLGATGESRATLLRRLITEEAARVSPERLGEIGDED